MINNMNEFIKFCIAGVLTFFIDYGLLYYLTEYVYLNYLLSAACSFTAAVIINYVICQLFVFKNSKNGLHQLSLFIGASLAGLFLNQFCMWFLVDALGIYYLIAKFFATAIVTLWNYFAKRYALKTN